MSDWTPSDRTPGTVHHPQGSFPASKVGYCAHGDIVDAHEMSGIFRPGEPRLIGPSYRFESGDA